jgi:hypothetical protein
MRIVGGGWFVDLRALPIVSACAVQQQEACAAARRGGLVVRVVQRAALERQAAAADARVELVAQLGQRGDARIEQRPPVARQPGPVCRRRRAFAGQSRERSANLIQGQSDRLRDASLSSASQRRSRVTPPSRLAAATAQQAFCLVIAQRAGRHAGALCKRTDRNPVAVVGLRVRGGHGGLAQRGIGWQATPECRRCAMPYCALARRIA